MVIYRLCGSCLNALFFEVSTGSSVEFAFMNACYSHYLVANM